MGAAPPDAEDSLKTIAQQLQQQMAHGTGHGAQNVLLDKRSCSLMIVDSEAGHRAVAAALQTMRDRLVTIQVQRIDVPLRDFRTLRLDKPMRIAGSIRKSALLSACRDLPGDDCNHVRYVMRDLTDDRFG